MGLIQINGDASITMRRRSDGEISMISIYVDDFLIASNNEQHLTSSSVRGEASSAISQRIDAPRPHLQSERNRKGER